MGHLSFEPEALLCLDWETYYAKDYTLRGNSTSRYIRDERFETIGVGVKVNGAKAVWMEDEDFREWAKRFDWSRIGLLAQNCLHGSVEVFTKSGWKSLRHLDQTEEILICDPVDASSKWGVPSAKVETKTRTWLKWDSNYHSCSYTPDHRIYYSTPDKKQWRVRTAREVSRLSPNNTYIPTGAVFEPSNPLDISPDEARFIEAARADGSWVTNGGKFYGIRFKFSKARKKQRLRELASRLGLNLREAPTTENGVLSMVLRTCSFASRVRSYLGPEKEYDNNFVLGLSFAARAAILDEARYWDGSSRTSPTTGVAAAKSYSWSCADEKTVGAVQLMAHVSGWTFSGTWRGNARGYNARNTDARLYVATICKKERTKLVTRAVETNLAEPEDAYCVTVDTGAFLVRSNDRVFVTGNCYFDGLILSHHYGLVPGIYFDTMGMANALHGVGSGSLASLAERYEVGAKGHEVENAVGKRRLDFSDEEWLRYGSYCKNDCELTYAIFQKMLANGFPEDELWVIDTTIRMFCDPQFKADEPLLRSFLVEERKRKQELLDRVVKEKSQLMSNDKFAKLLAELDVEAPRKISPRTGEETWAFAKSDSGMQELLEHERDEIRWLAEARVAVKSTINETRTERFLKLGENGRSMPVGLKYCGAHTHRWSAFDKSNFQNLKRGGTLRDALIAPEGKVVVAADSRQIEARKTAWLAGHDELVSAFSEGRDIYCEFASEVYGRTITKKDDRERRVGKTSILGLGFGMGMAKFGVTLMQTEKISFGYEDAETLNVDVQKFADDEEKANKVLAIPLRLSPEEALVHFAVAEAIIWKYRRKNKPITDLWKLMDAALEGMLEEEVEYAFGPDEILVTGRHGISKPNGLTLRYPGLRNVDGFSYMGGGGGKERKHIYGGMLTENVVQSLARDVVTWQMLRIRDNFGYTPVTMSHDELVFIVDKREGDKALEGILAMMKIPPPWARGLPVDAEGGIGRSYGEAK